MQKQVREKNCENILKIRSVIQKLQTIFSNYQLKHVGFYTFSYEKNALFAIEIGMCVSFLQQKSQFLVKGC